MLRRKLLIRLGALVVVYIAGAVVAIALLQGVLRDLNRVAATASDTAEAIDELESAVAAARAALEDRDVPAVTYRQQVLDAGTRVRAAYDALGERPVAVEAGAGSYRRIGDMLPGVAPDADWLSEAGVESWRRNSPAFAADLAGEIAHLRQVTRAALEARQLEITHRLRNLIIGLTIAALVALNVTILLLLRTGETIVRPVEALVAGSRELARERFDHRVEVPEDNEFGELAASYNQLAEQLRLNEQRKMETLQQLGVSLNHELNNVIGIIELQLAHIDRHAAGDEALKNRLVRIRGNLRRIAETVASLREVRRIVLTDYVPGTKMLDIRQSTEPDDPRPDEAGDPAPERAGPGEGARP